MISEWDEAFVRQCIATNRSLVAQSGGVCYAEGIPCGHPAPVVPGERDGMVEATGLAMGDAGLESLLRAGGVARVLRLGSNGISVQGARTLASILQSKDSRLEELYLCGNRLGDEGVSVLADALKSNCTLRVLDLGRNRFGDQGARDLAEFLRSNSSLQELNVWGNSIGPSGAAAVAEALRANRSLRLLVGAENSDEFERISAVLVHPKSKDKLGVSSGGSFIVLCGIALLVGLAVRWSNVI
jgi:hypothetical protein